MHSNLTRLILVGLLAAAIGAGLSCTAKRGINYGGVYYDDETAGSDFPDGVETESGAAEAGDQAQPRRSCDRPCKQEREDCYMESTSEGERTICQHRYDDCVKDCGG